MTRSLLALLGVLILATPAFAQDPAPTDTCYRIDGAAPYLAYGYNHVVTVTNTCDQPLQCQVWTDVDPDKRALSVPPNRSRDVVIRLGSPARSFSAEGVCGLTSD